MRYLALFLIFFSFSQTTFAYSYEVNSLFPLNFDLTISYEDFENIAIDEGLDIQQVTAFCVDVDTIESNYIISEPVTMINSGVFSESFEFNLPLNSNWIYMGLAMSYTGDCQDFGSATLYDFVSNPILITTQNDNQTWGSGGVFGDTNVAGAIASGVQTTGANIWPLLLFVGVFAAFAIAVMVQEFIMQAGARKREKYYSDLSNSKNIQQDFDIMKKNGRL